ncbi:MAG: hypothetical protein H6832_05025 [Planctomycetes bacterium]|nr:hypothetical protein [Planctomycetota bacterium]MCB9890502.1 hypothetical protein [Planctomycetota bacterium]MCB9917743.1 hypothetical protein [Planctomycetota bacterium]
MLKITGSTFDTARGIREDQGFDEDDGDAPAGACECVLGIRFAERQARSMTVADPDHEELQEHLDRAHCRIASLEALFGDRSRSPHAIRDSLGGSTHKGRITIGRIVTEDHTGTIRFETVVGEGTIFAIRLPRDAALDALPDAGENEP